MIGGKINLGQLQHVVVKKKGKDKKEIECMVIPIESNHLFKGKDGNIYLDIVAFELKDPKHNDTHLVKQSLPKEIREKQTEEEKNAVPILGNLNVNVGGGGAAAPNNAAPGVTLSDDDDLPF
jgi:hypothetical protein